MAPLLSWKKTCQLSSGVETAANAELSSILFFACGLLGGSGRDHQTPKLMRVVNRAFQGPHQRLPLELLQV